MCAACLIIPTDPYGSRHYMTMIQTGRNSNLASYAAVFYWFLNAQKYVPMTLLHLTMLMWSKSSLKLMLVDFLIWTILPDSPYEEK